MNAQETILSYIVEQLLNNRGSIKLGPDDNLLLSGLVDSHGVVRLVKFLEDKFIIKVHPSDITLKNFKTVNAIMAYVDRQTAVAG